MDKTDQNYKLGTNLFIYNNKQYTQYQFSITTTLHYKPVHKVHIDASKEFIISLKHLHSTRK